ncbi:MAG: hypothetical protein JWO06_480, partial [Bacteroidota bacterium]|nr:hypothetical protein [Bacteroidota bacterium]
NMMDTTCAAVVNTDSVQIDINYYLINDITGIQYFHNLRYLRCVANPLQTLPSPLPEFLNTLIVELDSLTYLPSLPNGITYLNVLGNQLTSLPPLPDSLKTLIYDGNLISTLPSFPANLSFLTCSNNNITSLPPLPPGITFIRCEGNQLTALPALPPALTYLNCEVNQLTHLPTLPTGLKSLLCARNQLADLPALPLGLTDLICSFNELTSLPDLPTHLIHLYCNSNPNLGCLPALKYIDYLLFLNTSVACIPYSPGVDSSIPSLVNYPSCLVSNPNNCLTYWNISGRVYFDADSNCIFNAGDIGQHNIKVGLYKDGLWQGDSFTENQGYYAFNVSASGDYTVVVDTAYLPFYVSCPVSNVESIAISSIDSFYSGKDFALHYTPTFNSITTLRDPIRFSLLPNPTHNTVTIQTENLSAASLQVTDLQGKEILTQKLTSTNYILDVSHLSAGLYIVKVMDLNGRIGVRKLVIE